MNKKMVALATLVFALIAIPGCGDTIVTPQDKVIKKEVKINEDGSSKTKETIVHQNADGSTTKTEKKTETKNPGDGDTIIKLPGVEIKKD